MPAKIQSSFTGGEWAPEYDGRTDLPLYPQACSLARNAVLQGTTGGMTRRPGFRYVANARDGTAYNVRLRRFSPSGNTQYTLEFGNAYIRFYRNKAPVLSAGNPFTLTTQYASADIAALTFTSYQQNLYIWHPKYPTQVLTWGGSDTAWTIAPYLPYDGPYLDAIGGITTATPSAAAGTATITLNNTTEVNNGAGFQVATDIGRLVRFQVPLWSLVGQVIPASGTNYNVGDITIPTGGTPLSPSAGPPLTAELTITKIGTGGQAQGAVISDPGQYLLPPSNSFTQGSTTGGGSGFAGGTLVWGQTNPINGAENATVWLPGVITAIADTTHATVTLGGLQVDAEGTLQQGVFPSTAAITSWRLGAWSTTSGFPSAGAVFQERLCAFGWAGKPKRVFASTSGGITTAGGSAPTGFASMSPSLGTGQVLDSSALEFDLDDDIGSAVQWASGAGSAQIPQLAIGSSDAEFILQGANAGVLTPTSLQAYRETRYGTAAVPPLRIGRALIFAERGGKMLRQWMYQYLAGGYIGPYAAPEGRHLTLDGIGRMDYAQIPFPVIWAATTGGNLVSLTFAFDEKEQSADVAGWNSHQLGGFYYGGPPQVVDLCVVPSENNLYDQVWLSVLRTDTGVAQQTIEVMDNYFRDAPLDQAFFLDGALQSALTLPNTTCALTTGPFASGQPLPQRGDTLIAAVGANLFSSNDLIPGSVLRINGGTFIASSWLNSAIQIGVTCIDSPTTLAPAAVNAWSYTKMVTSFSGFAALAGATVRVLADGSDAGTQTVPVSGTITLQAPASFVAVGRAYTSEIDTLDLDLPAQDGGAGASQMRPERLDHLYLRFFQSLGCNYGIINDDGTKELDPLPTRQASDVPYWAPALFTGDLRLPPPGGTNKRHRAVIQQTLPWPLTLSAIVVKGGLGAAEQSTQ